MPVSQESIEAKLCAYIDDELDAEGRAEIEKHLSSNPQHRRLIQELRRTTELVRGLPREVAPPELSEAFSAQLERSVLLEGVSGRHAQGTGLHWPQVLAMAAIVLLTVGLAIVVYFALPSTSRTPHFQLAQAPPMPSGSLSSGSLPSAQLKMRQEGALSSRVDDHAAPEADSFRASAAATTGPSETETLSVTTPAASAAPVASAPSASSVLADAVPADMPGRSPAVLLVEATEPAPTRRAVENYLQSNHIDWKPPTVNELTRESELSVMVPERRKLEKGAFGLRAAKTDERDANAVGSLYADNAFYVSCRLTPAQAQELSLTLQKQGASVELRPETLKRGMIENDRAEAAKPLAETAASITDQAKGSAAADKDKAVDAPAARLDQKQAMAKAAASPAGPAPESAAPSPAPPSASIGKKDVAGQDATSVSPAEGHEQQAIAGHSSPAAAAGRSARDALSLGERFRLQEQASLPAANTPLDVLIVVRGVSAAEPPGVVGAAPVPPPPAAAGSVSPAAPAVKPTTPPTSGPVTAPDDAADTDN